jgi:hypothetical protein
MFLNDFTHAYEFLSITRRYERTLDSLGMFMTIGGLQIYFCPQYWKI